MIRNYKKLFTAYYNLRNEIDVITKGLENMHSQHLKCKSGCDMCCMDYRIFPLEFYAIREELRDKGNRSKIPYNKFLAENACIFLVNHKCGIYKHHPIICRTHGLPLLFTTEEGEWQLSACELNFTRYNFEDFTFDNTFPQDKFNSSLFLLNKEFIQQFEEKTYVETDLIPIKELLPQL